MEDYLYLNELFGVEIANLSVDIRNYDMWIEQLGAEPVFLKGRKIITIGFETIVKMAEYEYGSIKVTSVSTSFSNFINHYSCTCLPGKETKELLSRI